MDLTEIVGKLPEDEKGIVLAAIEAEKNRGIEAANKKGAENAKLRRENEGFKSAIKNTFEFDVTSVDELPDALSKYKKTATVNTNDYVSKADFELVRKQVADRDAKLETAERQMRNSKTAEKLGQILGDGFHAKDLLIKGMIDAGQVRLTESGDVVFIEGDDEVEAVKGVESLKKKRPDLVKNTSKPGSGGAGGSKDKKNDGKIDYEQFEKLDPIAQRDYMIKYGGFAE